MLLYCFILDILFPFGLSDINTKFMRWQLFIKAISVIEYDMAAYIIEFIAGVSGNVHCSRNF